MRRVLPAAAFAGIVLTSGCLRYEVVKPPAPRKEVVLLKHFDFRAKPSPDMLPLPKALMEKRPEARFKILERE